MLIVIDEVVAVWPFGPVQLYVYGPVPPLGLAVNVCELPAQIVALAGLTVQVGTGLTVAAVEPAAEVQPLEVTVKLYVPVAAVVAFAIDGFCSVELKPLGPVQL